MNIVVALAPNAVYYVIAYVTAFSPISSQSTKALEKLPEIINSLAELPRTLTTSQ